VPRSVRRATIQRRHRARGPGARSQDQSAARRCRDAVESRGPGAVGAS
jgi:hypothetical protein